jgi:hypothetical protein
MRQPGTRLGRGLRFAGAASLFGGGAVFLVSAAVIPPQDRLSAAHWTVVAAWTAVWVAVGLIVGAFGAPAPRGGSVDEGDRARGGRAVAAAGGILYRLVVGTLLGFVVTAVAGLLVGGGIALVLGQLRGTFPAPVALATMFGAVSGGFVGSVTGSLTARPSRRVVQYTLLGGLLGAGLGAGTGGATTAVGAALVSTDRLHEVKNWFLVVPAIEGALAGVLAGLSPRLAAWSEGAPLGDEPPAAEGPGH